MELKGRKYHFIFLHDCNDCKYYNQCEEEKKLSTDCTKFQYKK